MSTNANLHRAKKEKNDEFYTRLVDIENELQHYEKHFNGKVVYCNCDDYTKSNFYVYFKSNFEKLGLKRLICVGYVKDGNGLYASYDGITEETRRMDGDGSFMSEESINYLKVSDIVVSNPPFSKFRPYIAQLVEFGKKFLVIGNMNAITFKEIFPLIKENKLWVGVNFNKTMVYGSPYENSNENNRKGLIKKGFNPDKFIQVPAISWFTNLEHGNRNEELILYKSYNEQEYPKYDNYDAINVNKVNEIPCDYNGVMGVPITFLGKYNPNQFEIVEFRKGNDGKDLVYSERERVIQPYFRILIRPTSIRGMIKNAEGKINGKPTYARILIRRIK